MFLFALAGFLIVAIAVDLVEQALDPSLATLQAAAEAASNCNATGIVGFGGGSSMDVAKLTALLAGSGEEID